jgi:hypothetical protein
VNKSTCAIYAMQEKESCSCDHRSISAAGRNWQAQKQKIPWARPSGGIELQACAQNASLVTTSTTIHPRLVYTVYCTVYFAQSCIQKRQNCATLSTVANALRHMFNSVTPSLGLDVSRDCLPFSITLLSLSGLKTALIDTKSRHRLRPHQR